MGARVVVAAHLVAVLWACGSESEAPAPPGGGSGGNPGTIGGGSSNGGSGGDAPASLAQFCEDRTASRRAWQAWIERCCVEGTSDLALFEALGIADPEQVTAACEATFGSELAATVTFRENSAAACLDDLEGLLPDVPDDCQSLDLGALTVALGQAAEPAQLRTCRAALEGQLNRGDPCAQDWECAAGGVCRLRDTVRVCRAPLGPGQPCERTGECAPGTLCLGDAVCGEPRGAGQPCVQAADCATPLRCVLGTCQGAEAGAVCTSALADCGLEAYCDTFSSQCTPLPGVGEACVQGQCTHRCDDNGVCVSFCGG